MKNHAGALCGVCVVGVGGWGGGVGGVGGEDSVSVGALYFGALAPRRGRVARRGLEAECMSCFLTGTRAREGRGVNSGSGSRVQGTSWESVAGGAGSSWARCVCHQGADRREPWGGAAVLYSQYRISAC